MQCCKLTIANLPLFYQWAHRAGQFVALYAGSSVSSLVEANHFLTGFDSYHTAGSPCLLLETWSKAMDRDVISHRRKTTTVIFKNKYAS